MLCFHWRSLRLIGHSRVLIIREEHIGADPQYPLIACSCVCVRGGTQALISDKKKEAHKQHENDLSPHKLASTHYMSQ